MNNKKEPLFVESLGMYLHKKLEVHLLITIVFNVISFFVVIGLFDFIKYPLVNYGDVIGVVIYALINTLIIEVIKMFLIRHLMNVIIKTKGLILLLINGVVFWLTSILFVESFSFRTNRLVTITSFTISFFIMKVLLIIALQRVRRKDEENERMDE